MILRFYVKFFSTKEDNAVLDLFINDMDNVTKILDKYNIEEELPFYKQYMRFSSDNNVDNFMKILKELPKGITSVISFLLFFCYPQIYFKINVTFLFRRDNLKIIEICGEELLVNCDSVFVWHIVNNLSYVCICHFLFQSGQ